METFFEATLQVALYPYNDLLIRAKPPAGHAFAADAINGEPIYMQIDGKPAIASLFGGRSTVKTP